MKLATVSGLLVKSKITTAGFDVTLENQCRVL
jgi:hypothetical protein